MPKPSTQEGAQRHPKRTPKPTLRARELVTSRKATPSSAVRHIATNKKAIKSTPSTPKPPNAPRPSPRNLLQQNTSKQMKRSGVKRQTSGHCSRVLKAPKTPKCSSPSPAASQSLCVNLETAFAEEDASTLPIEQSNQSVKTKPAPNKVQFSGDRSCESRHIAVNKHVRTVIGGKGKGTDVLIGEDMSNHNQSANVGLRMESMDAVVLANQKPIAIPEKGVQSRKPEVDRLDLSLPGFPSPPLHKGNGSFFVTSEVYIVHLSLLAIEKRVRGNVEYGHELRFNASEVSRLIHKSDQRLTNLVSNNQHGLVKLQRFLRKLNGAHAKWLRGGFPVSASVKNPETVKKHQLRLAKVAIKNSSITLPQYLEHMERVGLVCGHMGSYRPVFGVKTVGCHKAPVTANKKTIKKRASTYDIDENSSDSSEDVDVAALQGVESDSEDDGGSPSGGPKRKSARDGLTKGDILIVPVDGDEGHDAGGDKKEDGVRSGKENEKKTSTKGVPNNARVEAASGRGKRSIPPVGNLPGLEKFVEIIGDSTKAQAARDDRRIQLEVEIRKEQKLFKQLEVAQKLVSDNPGNAVYERMLERLARKAFSDGST